MTKKYLTGLPAIRQAQAKKGKDKGTATQTASGRNIAPQYQPWTAIRFEKAIPTENQQIAVPPWLK